jgi:hypothetical protein
MTPLRGARLNGHARVVRMLIAHAARNAVRELADAAVESLAGMLLRELPELAAQAAALCLPLYVAAALSESEEDQAAALASGDTAYASRRPRGGSYRGAVQQVPAAASEGARG